MNEQKFRDYGLLWLRLALGCAILFLHGWGRIPRVYNYLVLGQPWTFINLVGKIGFPAPSFFALASAVGAAAAVAPAVATVPVPPALAAAVVVAGADAAGGAGSGKLAPPLLLMKTTARAIS